jgi:stage II sporulation protein D
MRGTQPLSARNANPAGAPGLPLRPAVWLALLLTLSAVAAPAAHGAKRLVVSGAGFGHGVGMSQYGAFGYAKAGADHAAILGHYYTGTQLTKADGATQVRVLLKTASRIVFTKATGVAGGRRLDPRQSYTATRAVNGVIALRSARGRDLGIHRSPLTITGSPAGLRLFGRSGNAAVDGRYRGNLEIRGSALGGVSAINAVGLEDYIRSVVAGEMPTSWPAEALRAQAVAARTYAISTSKEGDGFDQYADTRSQVYNGISGETPATDSAVAATAGELVTFAGKPIITYYFSTSGGRTENVENSFLGAVPEPYLTSVDDPFDDASPRHRWVRRMSIATAQARLGGLVKGGLTQIRVLQRGSSPRVVRAEVVGTGGTTRVSGPTLRRKLGLYDTWARFTVIDGATKRGDGNTPAIALGPPTPLPSGATPAEPAAPPSGGTVPIFPPGPPG